MQNENNNNNLGSFQMINGQQPQAQTTPVQPTQGLFQQLETVETATPVATPQAMPTAAPVTAAAVDLNSLLATTEAMDPAETQYRKLPEGTHYVKFKEMEFTVTKTDKPIVWIKYTAVGGDNDGIDLAESFYLGGDEVWQVQRSIGNMKHRLQIDFGLTTLPWEQGFEQVALQTNALAAQLHFHATVVYPVNAKTGETSEYATIESIVKA